MIIIDIAINIEKLNNAPCESSDLIDEITDNEIITKIANQLSSNLTSCNLISGYRGSGKTSMICKLKAHLLKENIKEGNIKRKVPKVLFVEVNLPEYEDISFILRKLIRGIYLNKPKKALKRSIKNFIDLLYLRTFNDVVFKVNYMHKKELNIVTKFTSDNLLSLILLIISGTIAFFSYLGQFNIKIISISFSLLLSSLIFTSSYNRSKSEEMDIKSLYDNDIAEYKIKEVLEKLIKSNYKVAFVIDEMDKIEDQSNLEKIIIGLKSLMLSDLASFIIVSGQKLYYKYINEYTADDSLLTNIFSGFHHVPLKSVNSFKNIFFELLLEDRDKLKEDELLKFYIDSVILNSNRIIRNFNSIIFSNIIWNDDTKPILKIDSSNLNIYKTDSILLDAINKLYQNVVEKLSYDKCINDFLSIQLHIWVKKIKQKGKYHFREDEIFDISKIDTNLLFIKENLVYLFYEFIKEFINSGIIREKYEGTTRVYSNILEIEDNNQNTFENNKIIASNKITEIEKLIKAIYNDCISDDSSHKELLEIVKHLKTYNIINDDLNTKITEYLEDGSLSDDLSSQFIEGDLNKIIHISELLVFSHILFIINNEIHSLKLLEPYTEIINLNSISTFNCLKDNQKLTFYYYHLNEISINNFQMIINNLSSENSKIVLLISISYLSIKDRNQIIIECYQKKFKIIFCYCNGTLISKEELNEKINKI